MRKIRAVITMEITEAAILEHAEPGETFETWQAMLKEVGESVMEDAPPGMVAKLVTEVIEEP